MAVALCMPEELKLTVGYDVASFRDLRDLTGKKGGEVAKLFAKHFKLAEHVGRK